MAHQVGTDGNDKLRGTKDSDVLGGRDGNDDLSGRAGDDFLFGGNGNDKMKGGRGDDLLDGGGGNDRYKGGDGNDTFVFHDYGGKKVVQDFTYAPGQEVDKIKLVGDSDFVWKQTGIGEITVTFGETEIIFNNVTGRELSYQDVFILDDFGGSII